jgi:hypothetical protein
MVEQLLGERLADRILRGSLEADALGRAGRKPTP